MRNANTYTDAIRDTDTKFNSATYSNPERYSDTEAQAHASSSPDAVVGRNQGSKGRCSRLAASRGPSTLSGTAT